MIFISALCFLVTLTSVLANQTKVDQLTDTISSAVAGEIVQVAKAAAATNTTNTQELNNQLLNTTNRVLQRMAPQVKELVTLSGNSTYVAQHLVGKISQNEALKILLDNDAKLASRGIKLPSFSKIVNGIDKTVHFADEIIKRAKPIVGAFVNKNK